MIPPPAPRGAAACALDGLSTDVVKALPKVTGTEAFGAVQRKGLCNQIQRKWME